MFYWYVRDVKAGVSHGLQFYPRKYPSGYRRFGPPSTAGCRGEGCKSFCNIATVWQNVGIQTDGRCVNCLSLVDGRKYQASAVDINLTEVTAWTRCFKCSVRDIRCADFGDRREDIISNQIQLGLTVLEREFTYVAVVDCVRVVVSVSVVADRAVTVIGGAVDISVVKEPEMKIVKVTVVPGRI